STKANLEMPMKLHPLSPALNYRKTLSTLFPQYSSRRPNALTLAARALKYTRWLWEKAIRRPVWSANFRYSRTKVGCVVLSLIRKEDALGSRRTMEASSKFHSAKKNLPHKGSVL